MLKQRQRSEELEKREEKVEKEGEKVKKKGKRERKGRRRGDVGKEGKSSRGWGKNVEKFPSAQVCKRAPKVRPPSVPILFRTSGIVNLTAKLDWLPKVANIGSQMLHENIQSTLNIFNLFCVLTFIRVVCSPGFKV